MSKYLQYGGQAVIEGVMMRSPRFFAVACRKPDKTIVVQTEPVEHSIVGKLKWLNRPFLRGTLALVDAMALGTKALSFSAQVQAVEGPLGQSEGGGQRAEELAAGTETELAPGVPAPAPVTAAASPTGRINDIYIGGALVFAFCFGLFLFVALPTLLAQPVQRQLSAHGTHALTYGQQVGLNLLDGCIRITIFLIYIGMIGRMENIKRVFQYHGAEHKAINNLESGEPLSVDGSMRASRIHPRCGTSFIIVVLLASILVHSVFPRPENYFVRLALHLALVPVVAGFAYEVIRLAGRFRDLALFQVLLAPGLWSQRLTTREPEPDQVEVALAALQAVLEREQDGADANAPEAAAAAVA